MSVFSTPRGPGREDCEVDEVLVAGIVPEEEREAVPVGPCSSGAELEAQVGVYSTPQSNQGARSAPSSSRPDHELAVWSNVDAMPRMSGWLDDTHAMLDAVDGRHFAAR